MEVVERDFTPLQLMMDWLGSIQVLLIIDIMKSQLIPSTA